MMGGEGSPHEEPASQVVYQFVSYESGLDRFVICQFCKQAKYTVTLGMVLWYLVFILCSLGRVGSRTFTLIEDNFVVNVTSLNLHPKAVFYADINETNGLIPTDFIFQSSATLRIRGNGVPYHEPIQGGHFKVFVVVDADSPLSNHSTNTSVAGASRCISVGESLTEFAAAVEEIQLSPHENTSYVDGATMEQFTTTLSTLFSVTATSIGTTHSSNCCPFIMK